MPGQSRYVYDGSHLPKCPMAKHTAARGRLNIVDARGDCFEKIATRPHMGATLPELTTQSLDEVRQSKYTFKLKATRSQIRMCSPGPGLTTRILSDSQFSDTSLRRAQIGHPAYSITIARGVDPGQM